MVNSRAIPGFDRIYIYQRIGAAVNIRGYLKKVAAPIFFTVPASGWLLRLGSIVHSVLVV